MTPPSKTPAPPRVPRLVFPVLVLAPVATTLGLVSLGLAPALATVLSALGLLALVAALERQAPYREEWNEVSRAELRTDLVYVTLAAIPDRLARVAAELALVATLGTALWPPALGLPEQLVRALVAFLVGDLAKYALHRLSHENAWLWRIHAVHHLPERVSVTNALRVHPVNIAANALCDALPMLLLGVTGPLAAVIATLRATFSILQHANLDLERGRQWLFNTPSHHRTHHGVAAFDGHSNYGSSLLVWDRLFGTLRSAAAPERVGVEGTDRMSRGYLAELWFPLCAHRVDGCRFERWLRRT